MTVKLSRRVFIALTAAVATAAGARLIVGLRPNGAIAAGSEQAVLNPFVNISADGHVTVTD